MTAKQILVSASLVIGTASTGSAAGDPGEAEDRSAGEVSVISSGEPTPATGRFEIGAGYQPDDQFLAAATVAQDDLFGTKDQLSLHAMVSGRRQLFLLHFADPSLGGSQVGLAADLFSQETAWPGFTRSGTGGALTLSRAIAPGARAFFSYRVELVEVDLEDREMRAPDGLPEASALPRTDLLLSSLRAGVELGSAGGFLPRRGSSAGAWIEASDRRLGSDANLIRGRVWASHHQPIGPLTLHLGARAEAIGSNEPGGVPLSERVQLDGSSDVRGFAPGALGRVDPVTGVAGGGDVLMTGRAELELPVIGRLGLSVLGFADGGAVMDARAGTAGFGASAGIGLLWRSPIGPIRVDWAFPLDGDRSAPQVLFSLGGSF
jgi:outer membrane protein insertion porin family